VSFDVWHSRANRESDDDFGDLKIVTKTLIAGTTLGIKKTVMSWF